MSATRTILQARATAFRGSVRRERPARAALALTLLAGLLAFWWSLSWLSGRLHVWEVAGPEVLRGRLWLLLGAAWLAVGAFAAVATFQDGLGDEAALLLTLPVPPAARFRVLYVRALRAVLGVPSLLGTLAPLAVLGIEAPRWLPVSLAGLAAATLGGVLAALLAVRHLLTGVGRGAATVVGAPALVAAAAWSIAGGVHELARVPPEPIAPLLAIALVAAQGPGASRLGDVYRAAAQAAHGRSASRRGQTLPGLRALVRALEARRTPTAAMLVRELLSQGRDPFLLVRPPVTVAALPIYLWLRERPPTAGLPEPRLLAGPLPVLTFYSAVDTTSSPIGSEGNHLALALTAPVRSAEILRAKLVAHLVPLLAQPLAMGVVLGWWTGIDAADLWWALATASLAVAAAATLLVWGSAWDEDVHLPVEGPVPTLLHEHVPITTRRIWLLTASGGVLAVALLLSWRLPSPLVPGAVGLLGLTVAPAAWRFAHRQLVRLGSPA